LSIVFSRADFGLELARSPLTFTTSKKKEKNEGKGHVVSLYSS
jgi:hypothetical protein